MTIKNNDIVTRLRNYDFMRDGDTPDLTMIEAADEIERWRYIAKELYTWLQPSPEDDSVYEAGIEAMAMYDEAIYDE